MAQKWHGIPDDFRHECPVGHLDRGGVTAARSKRAGQDEEEALLERLHLGQVSEHADGYHSEDVGSSRSHLAGNPLSVCRLWADWLLHLNWVSFRPVDRFSWS